VEGEVFLGINDNQSVYRTQRAMALFVQQYRGMNIQLHSFFRSATFHRVRIALNLTGVAYGYVAVDLRADAHLNPAFRAINPQGLLPVLDTGEGKLIQSPAILEWLEEVYPTPPLLPSGAGQRAHVRALSAIVGCDIHPLNNKRILTQLRRQFGADESVVNAWCGQRMSAGFDALETMLAVDKARGIFCFGGVPSVADVYLVPQADSACRCAVDVAAWPHIAAVEAASMSLPAFVTAAPSCQPDAP
jgi:maleylpyruvate isomerase